MLDWNRLAAIIHGSQSFLLTTHVRPDGDALGSELGLAFILQSMGKQVSIVNADGVSRQLRFLDGQQQLQTLPDGAQALPDHDVLIIVDTSSWQQLGRMAPLVQAAPSLRLVIDHHVSSDDMQAYVFKNSKAEATGRLIVELAEKLRVAFNAPAATALFVAIATDTGWFRFPSATEETYKVIARLVAAGASPSAIYKQLYEQDTEGRLKLLGQVMSRVESELGGRLVHTAALVSDYAATGATPAETEDMVNMLLTVGTAEVALLFVELSDQQTKVSFRSRSEVDCSRLAEKFSGGGHRAAAGARILGPYSAARNKVLDAVLEAMR